MCFFYDITDNSFPDGILESETVLGSVMEDIKNKFVKGPFTFSGSNRFYEVFRKDKFKSFLRIFTLPD